MELWPFRAGTVVTCWFSDLMRLSDDVIDGFEAASSAKQRKR
jgi:hypothetical protein